MVSTNRSSLLGDIHPRKEISFHSTFGGDSNTIGRGNVSEHEYANHAASSSDPKPTAAFSATS
jgi:hypothetical protein